MDIGKEEPAIFIEIDDEPIAIPVEWPKKKETPIELPKPKIPEKVPA